MKNKKYVLDETELKELGVSEEDINNIPFENVSIYSYTGDNLIKQTKWCMDGWTASEEDRAEVIDKSKFENADELLSRIGELNYSDVMEDIYGNVLGDRIEEIADDLNEALDGKVLNSIDVDDILGYII